MNVKNTEIQNMKALNVVRLLSGLAFLAVLGLGCGRPAETSAPHGTRQWEALTGRETINFSFDPGRVTSTCTPVKISATVTPGDRNPLEYGWAVTNAPASARYLLEPDGSTAQFTSEAAGDFDLQVSVTDLQGVSISSSFSMHVDAGRVRHCLRQPISLDLRFEEIARRVPQFGGVYLDEDQNLVLVLTDTSPRVATAAEAAVRDIIGADRPLPSGPPRVVQGDYGFDYLMANRVRARETLALPGVVLVGVDEMRNRVRIGVADTGALRAVHADLARLGVDRAATLVEITQPIGLFADAFEEQYRPVIGGTQIQLDDGGLCTLGFVADRKGTRGYITASHCTDIQGGVEGTVHAQNLFVNEFKLSDPNAIGMEIADPIYFKGGDCPKNRRCRFSDTSFSAMKPDVTNLRGKVFRAEWSLGIALPTLPYQVVDSLQFPLSGETLKKMGRTTGESYGKVTGTCDDVNVDKTDITLFCQGHVSAKSDHGDSGSPVFMDISSTLLALAFPGVDNPVFAAGILWGGPEDKSSFMFSPMGNLQRSDELGKVAVTFSIDPPSISILHPTDGDQLAFGPLANTLLEAKTDDTQDGPDCCEITWTSSLDGSLGTGKKVNFTFQTPGVRTITATAKNSFGKMKSTSVTVSTAVAPPIVTIAKPTSGQVLWSGLETTIHGWAWDSQVLGLLPCNSLTWTSNAGDADFPVQGCAPQVKFLFAGNRVLTLTGLNDWGASGTASVAFSVANPQSLVASILQPVNNSHFFPDQPQVTLQGTAQDTDPSATLSYKWTLQKEGAPPQVIGTTMGPSGGQSTVTWQPNYPSCGGGYPATIILEVTGPSGTATDSVGVYIHPFLC